MSYQEKKFERDVIFKFKTPNGVHHACAMNVQVQYQHRQQRRPYPNALQYPRDEISQRAHFKFGKSLVLASFDHTIYKERAQSGGPYEHETANNKLQHNNNKQRKDLLFSTGFSVIKLEKLEMSSAIQLYSVRISMRFLTRIKTEYVVQQLIQ